MEFGLSTPTYGATPAIGLARSTSSRPSLARFTALPAIGLVVGILLLNRQRVTVVARDVMAMRLQALIVVGGLVVLHRSIIALLHRACVDGVSFRRMAVAVEAHTGASHSVIGGSGVGTGLRVAMLRSWGVDPASVTAAILLTSLVPTLAMWAIAMAHTMPLLAAGQATQVEAFVAVLSTGVLAVMVVGGARLLHGDAAPRIAHRIVERTRGVLGARISNALPSGDVRSGVGLLQHRTLRVLRSNGPFLVLASIGSQLVLALLVAASASAMAPSASIPLLTVLRTFALLQVLSAFVPIPGGLGVVDVGLVATLHAAGLDTNHAIGALALYRTCTFVLPILTGPLCALAWWLRTPRRRAALLVK
jgi:uncharacterized membrane protein YbhN (UPF0104 family)